MEREDRPRSGRPRTVTRKVEEKIVQKTTGEDPPPEESTHWTSRLMGKALGIDHVTIWRVWRKYGLKPHQIRRFKLSRDPRLVEKLHDVVGVYMNPPDNAVVFSFDEKSQIQALASPEEGPSRHHDARLQAPYPLCGIMSSDACPGTGIGFCKTVRRSRVRHPRVARKSPAVNPGSTSSASAISWNVGELDERRSINRANTYSTGWSGLSMSAQEILSLVTSTHVKWPRP